MPTFQNILFPVDFSMRCTTVRPWVESTASHFNAQLTLIHVVQVPVIWYGGIDGACEPVYADVTSTMQQGEQQLETFWSSTQLRAKRVVDSGDPGMVISDYAAKNGVDLIMMPTHGYGRFRSLLLGSVTAKVLYDSECAVWTAAHSKDPMTDEGVKYRSLLCAVDIAPESVELIRGAAAMASEFSAKLRLVHAVTTVATAGPEKYLETEFRQFMFQANREEVMKLQRKAGTDLELCLDGGSVSEVVHAAALHHDADLVMIGRGKLHESFGRLRTNAYAIIRDAPCPVLSF